MTGHKSILASIKDVLFLAWVSIQTPLIWRIRDCNLIASWGRERGGNERCGNEMKEPWEHEVSYEESSASERP
jgi:hypothetical protein